MKIWLPAIRAGSGADVYTQRLAAALHRAGHEAVVTWLPLWAELLPGFKRVRPPADTDLIHANSWHAFPFARFGKPVVVTVHHCVHDPEIDPYKSFGQRLYHQGLIRRYEQQSFNSAQAIVTVSGYTRSQVIRQFENLEIKVIHNWVDTGVFRPIPHEQEKHGARPFRLLFAGNRSRRKGWDVLPELMSRLGSGFELTVACGLRSDVPKLELPPNTTSLGVIQDEKAMVAAYRQCDALVMPSRLEGFGYVTAEAMACGKPVVAFRNSATSEVVADLKTGLLVATDDIEGTAAACRQLANNPELAARMGRAARQRIEENFSESTAIERYIELYEEILGRADRASSKPVR